MEAPKEEWSWEWEQMEKICIFLVTRAKGEHSFPSFLCVSSATGVSHTYKTHWLLQVGAVEGDTVFS